MGLDEMTGSPNIIIVPDPSTFRVLPWEPRVGWILCDDYFTSGLPFHFSPRHLLKKQVERLNGRGLRSIIGLEVEWYLLRLADDRLTEENLGAPGIKGRALQAYPVEPGYSFHSETQFDLMHEPIVRLADAYEALNLPVRSFENEWGPGQVECTFGPVDALRAADNMLLFRTATRQIAAPNRLFRKLYVPAESKGTLFERMAPAPVRDRFDRSKRFHTDQDWRATLDARQGLSGWLTGSRSCRHGVRKSDRECLPALSRQLARAGPCNLGDRPSRRHAESVGRDQRSGLPHREPAG